MFTKMAGTKIITGLVGTLGLLWFGERIGWAQPTNDNFAEAILLNTTPGASQTIEFSGNTVDATSEPDEDLLGFVEMTQRGNIWWRWTSDTNYHVDFVAYATNASLIGCAFEGPAGEEPPSLLNISAVTFPTFGPSFHPQRTFNAASATFNAEPGKTYWFAVAPFPDLIEPQGAVFGKLTITAYTPPPPPPPPSTNDLFADRLVLSGTNVAVIGNNSAAGTEPGENIGNGAASLSSTLWYSWTAPTSGVLRVTGSTAVPNFILSIGVYVGNAIDALAPAPTTPDGGVAVVAGDTIVFQVGTVFYHTGGGGGGRGVFTMNLSLEVPSAASPNDAFADAIGITTNRFHFSGSIYGATSEPGEPLPAAGMNQTLWWRFNATEDGLFSVYLSAGQFQSAIAFYEGTDPNALSRLDAVNGTRFRVEAGRQYSLQLGGGVLTSGDFDLEVRFHSATNDFFAGSEHLEGTNFTYFGNFTAATPEASEPTPGAPNTVWASWTAPFNGRVRYWLDGPASYQFLTVYTGTALADLTVVPLVDEVNGVRNFIASEGTVYHFQFSGGGDDFTFNFTSTPFESADNDDFANARIAGSSDVIRFPPASVYDASMEVGEPLHLGSDPQKSLWWRWEAPRHGVLKLSASSLLIPSVVLAVYQGPSVDALGIVTKGTNQLQFRASVGEIYHIAASVPEDALGDISLFAQQIGLSATDVMLPGNILQDPSFEGTSTGLQYWYSSGDLGGYVNESGGAHGRTWPALSPGAKLWQDVPTIPGHEYALQFAFLFGRNLSGCCGDAGYRVYWDTNVIKTVIMPEEEFGYWRWDVVTFQATNTTTRITFENIHRILEVDAFSLVDLSAPPTIATQPSTVRTAVGGAAAFVVTANGSAPLSYHWFHNGESLARPNSGTLVIDPATGSDAGDYHVVVSNALGIATSAIAALIVDAPTNVTILLQPYGAVIPAGSYFNLSVVAAGAPPLTYQWYRDGQPLAEGTNRYFNFEAVDLTNAGTYTIRVQNSGGSAFSLPATLTVTNAISGGGTLDYSTFTLRFVGGTNDVPIFDVDGVTRLNGSNYVAQLYAGITLETMRPCAAPVPFRTGLQAGYFTSRTATFPNIPPGTTILAQLRAWEIRRGSSYEEARAVGGKFGRSPIVQVTLGPALAPPQRLFGLSSFKLEAGLPEFTVGQIEFLQRNSNDSILWQLRGEAGFRYVVEKTAVTGTLNWVPFIVLTNSTGTVTFEDQTGSGEGTALYRARIFD